MESEDVSHPLDDADPPDGARAVDPAGASIVSACGAAIVNASESAERPHVEQNRAPSGRLAPHLGQATAEFYATAHRPQKNRATEKHRRTAAP